MSRLNPRPLTVPDVRRCWDDRCPDRPAWRVNTASGWVAFCDEHAEWYRRQGPNIYPVERLPREEQG